jgi:glycerophosphoryl diester phosphodiesterase
MVSPLFDVQGHRGARGLKPENTLPSFEAALDAGVTSVETDVYLSRNGIPVLSHDPVISEHLCHLVPGSDSPPPAPGLLLSSLTLAELRGYRADRNPDPSRFPDQDTSVTPLARLFAEQNGIDPYTLPRVAELYAFVTAYSGDLGKRAGKTEKQQAGARRLRIDLEIKRTPFHPEYVADDFDGDKPGVLEHRLVDLIRAADLLKRVSVRSFDHRSVRALGSIEPLLETAILVSGMAPVDPVELTEAAGARTYCPDYHFLDARQVSRLHAAGIKVLPWTVNEPADWQRLIDWGVDGITTDFPDRLAAFIAWPPVWAPTGG